MRRTIEKLSKLGARRVWGDSVGRNLTDRAKGERQAEYPGCREGRLAEREVAAGANVHDAKLLRQALENIVVARPDCPGKVTEGLSRDFEIVSKWG